MIVRREAQSIGVAEAPCNRLDRVLRIADARAQNRACAHAARGCAFEGRDDGTGPLHTEVRVAARQDDIGRVVGRQVRGREQVVAQPDLLARDLVLVAARTIVETRHPGVRRRALRPVEPSIIHHDLLRGMIAGRQAPDAGNDVGGLAVLRDLHLHDTRGVVAESRRAAGALVRISAEEPAAAELDEWLWNHPDETDQEPSRIYPSRDG